MAARGIHIISGPSAAACLREGLDINRESVLISHDVLSAGPLLPLDSLENWTRRRHEYLKSMDDRFAFIDEDCDLLSNAEVLRASERLTLWIGTGLSEQLLFLWVVELLKFLDADLAKFNVVQFDQSPFEIVNVGVLKPIQFQQHPNPLLLDGTRLREARTAWAAVTAPDPGRLLSFLTAEKPALPQLQRSLHALLYRYPGSKSGVNAWDAVVMVRPRRRTQGRPRDWPHDGPTWTFRLGRRRLLVRAPSPIGRSHAEPPARHSCW